MRCLCDIFKIYAGHKHDKRCFSSSRDSALESRSLAAFYYKPQKNELQQQQK